MGRLACVLLAVAALLLAACGGGGGGDPAPDDAKEPAGRPGGKLTVLSVGDVDSLDPGRTYYWFGSMLSTAMNRTLYAYRPGDSDRPVPDLAAEAPEISEDRRTVKVKLRKGVRFSPPVNREVKAADVKYAIERAFSSSVANGYARFYFDDIVGVPARLGPARRFGGIEVPDDRTIVFRLSEATGVQFATALTLPVTAPVPVEYARRFDRKVPSTYDRRVVFTGPYMVRNNADGKLIGHRPGRSIDIVRNPNWEARTDFRPAYVDEVRVDESAKGAAGLARRVLRGPGLVQGDLGPPAPVLEDALRGNREQVRIVPGGSFRMVALNTRLAPFDDADVRRAVVAAADREALRRTRGGATAGDIPTHFLPPGYPGFEEAGGAKGPGADFLRNPRGDLGLARRYLRRAGYRRGVYDGPARPLMIGSSEDPGRRTALAVRDGLARLGIRVRLRLVDADSAFTLCGRPAAKAAVCANVGLFADFQDPQSMLEPVFSGARIQPEDNLNWAQLDDPQINGAMVSAGQLPAGEERDRAWGRIDRDVTRMAPGIPWLWEKVALLSSPDVRGAANQATRSWDISFTSVGGD